MSSSSGLIKIHYPLNLFVCLFLSKVPVNNRKLRVSLTPIPPSPFQHSASCWDFIQNSSLKEMQTSLCLADLRDMLPPPYKVKRATRSSLSMPSHALEEPTSRTHSTGRSFLHTAVSIWNSLPEDIVGLIGDRGAQSFKMRVHKHLLHTDLPR